MKETIVSFIVVWFAAAIFFSIVWAVLRWWVKRRDMRLDKEAQDKRDKQVRAELENLGSPPRPEAVESYPAYKSKYRK